MFPRNKRRLGLRMFFRSFGQQTLYMVKFACQNSQQWGFQGFGHGRYFAADFCHTFRMNFELVFQMRERGFCSRIFFVLAQNHLVILVTDRSRWTNASKG